MDEILKILAEWNVWWSSGKVSENLIGKNRGKTEELMNSLKLREIKIITGIRRCGKSTLLYQVIDNLVQKGVDPKNILLINLEDAGLRHYSLDEIYKTYLSFNPSNEIYLFIDEIQRKKGWEQEIRKKYDLRHAKNFFISGSCSSLLKKEYSTLLTGRNLMIEIFPLSFKEFLEFSKIRVKHTEILTEKTKSEILACLRKYLEFGGFPEIFSKEKEFKRKILNQYFEDIIYKDIVDRYDINSVKAKEFGVYLLTNVSNLLSYRNIRNSLGLGMDTIKDYMTYMKEAYLVFEVSHYSPSLKSQMANPKKIYCIDTGLRNAVSFRFSRDVGRLAENIIFVELMRRGRKVYYWKDEQHKEVDFIVKNKTRLEEPIQVCWDVTDENTKKREVNGLVSAMKELKLRKGVIITEDFEKTEKVDKKTIKYIPLWKWLLWE